MKKVILLLSTFMLASVALASSSNCVQKSRIDFAFKTWKSKGCTEKDVSDWKKEMQNCAALPEDAKERDTLEDIFPHAKKLISEKVELSDLSFQDDQPKTLNDCVKRVAIFNLLKAKDFLVYKTSSVQEGAPLSTCQEGVKELETMLATQNAEKLKYCALLFSITTDREKTMKAHLCKILPHSCLTP